MPYWILRDIPAEIAERERREREDREARSSRPLLLPVLAACAFATGTIVFYRILMSTSFQDFLIPRSLSDWIGLLLLGWWVAMLVSVFLAIPTAIAIGIVMAVVLGLFRLVRWRVVQPWPTDMEVKVGFFSGMAGIPVAWLAWFVVRLTDRLP